jgi:hypothetical protein
MHYPNFANLTGMLDSRAGAMRIVGMIVLYRSIGRWRQRECRSWSEPTFGVFLHLSRTHISGGAFLSLVNRSGQG